MLLRIFITQSYKHVFTELLYNITFTKVNMTFDFLFVFKLSDILQQPEGRTLVLSLWNIGATMQNISFENFLTLSTN